MAKAKATNLKELSVDDLKNRVVELQSEWLAAKQKVRLGQFKKISDFSRLRKEVARSKTELRQRELGQKPVEKTKTKAKAKSKVAKSRAA